MARLRSEEETPQKNRLSKLFGRKSLSPSPSGDTTPLISSASSVKLKRGFVKVGLFPSDRVSGGSRVSTGSDDSGSATIKPANPKNETLQMDTLEPMAARPYSAGTTKSQPVELSAVDTKVAEGDDTEVTSIFLGAKSDEGSKGYG